MSTVGKTTIGNIYSGGAAGYILAAKIVMPENGQITKISAYIRGDVGANGIFVIYNATGTKVAESNPIALTTNPTWTDFPLDFTAQAGQTYYFAVLTNTGLYIMADAAAVGAGTEVRGYSDAGYPIFPDPIVWREFIDREFSIYATYTPIIAPSTYTLTVSPSVNGSTNPSSGSYLIASGTIESITAQPDTGYQIEAWIVDGVNAGSDTGIIVTMNKDHTVSITFKPISPPPLTTHSLTINSVPIEGITPTVEAL